MLQGKHKYHGMEGLRALSEEGNQTLTVDTLDRQTRITTEAWAMCSHLWN